MDIPLFNDEVGVLLWKLILMEKKERKAGLILRGCAMEIVSPTTFKATPSEVKIQLGDWEFLLEW